MHDKHNNDQQAYMHLACMIDAFHETTIVSIAESNCTASTSNPFTYAKSPAIPMADTGWDPDTLQSHLPSSKPPILPACCPGWGVSLCILHFHMQSATGNGNISREDLVLEKMQPGWVCCSSPGSLQRPYQLTAPLSFAVTCDVTEHVT